MRTSVFFLNTFFDLVFIHPSVLNREDPDWYWIVRSDGQEGFIPSGFVYPADNVIQGKTVHTEIIEVCIILCLDLVIEKIKIDLIYFNFFYFHLVFLNIML